VVGHRGHRRVQVQLRDRFKVGDVGARLCVLAPARREACHSVALPAGTSQLVRSYRASGPGIWSAALQTAWKEGGTARVYVRPRGKLHLLATGDSMIQILDGFLKSRLAPHGVKVRSDSRISTGISKPFLLNWPKLARHQATSLRPDVTVVFIGANDGFPFGNVSCCGDDWVDAYATRVQSMMTAYSRQGRGVVYWLTLPAPQPAQWKPVYPAVNRAIRRAASGFAGQVRVVDIAKVISPGYRFRTTISWHGKHADVRQGDGVHLSVAGASIAEQVIQAALRRDGVI
jgi:hypothetical protein